MSFSFFNLKDKKAEAAKEPQVLAMSAIRTGLSPVPKEEAIRMAGELLVEHGCVEPAYVDAMMERELLMTTYIGRGIAIPHGVGAAKDKIIRSGICILQFPQGVDFGEGNKAQLVVGIAGKGTEHMKILTNLAELINETDVLDQLFKTTKAADLYKAFAGKL